MAVPAVTWADATLALTAAGASAPTVSVPVCPLMAVLAASAANTVPPTVTPSVVMALGVYVTVAMPPAPVTAVGLLNCPTDPRLPVSDRSTVTPDTPAPAEFSASNVMVLT